MKLKIAAALLLAVAVGIAAMFFRYLPKGRAAVFCPEDTKRGCRVTTGGKLAFLPFNQKYLETDDLKLLTDWETSVVEVDLQTSDGFNLRAAVELRHKLRLRTLYQKKASMNSARASEQMKMVVVGAVAPLSRRKSFEEIIYGESKEAFIKQAEDSLIHVFTATTFQLDKKPTVYLKPEPEQEENYVRSLVSPNGQKVLLIGLDGMDWNIANPLLEKGLLPNIKRLMDEGISGNLRSFEPILSPLIWTTVATGKMPEEHGILDFVYPDEETGKMLPVTSANRLVKAIWLMTGMAGKTAGVVNWYASWPAEKIDGIMVSNMALLEPHTELDEQDKANAISVWPPEFEEEIKPLYQTSGNVEDALFNRFVNRGFDGTEAFLEKYERETSHLDQLKNMIASQLSHRDIGARILKEKKPDLAGFYFEMPDVVCHQFLEYAPPPREWLDPSALKAFGGAVDAAYRLVDETVGMLAEAAASEYNIIIVSDHGFKTGDNRPRESGAMEGKAAALWHRLNGVIVAAGPAFRKGETISGAKVIDIAPTVLYALGMPQGRDMQGIVLTDLFTEEFKQAVPLKTIPTWEIGGEASLAKRPPGERTKAEEAVLEKLQGLGYIGATENEGESAELRENINLGVRYQKAGEADKAIETMLASLKNSPDDPSVLAALGNAYMSKQDWEKAEESFGRAASIEPAAAVHRVNLGALYINVKNFQRAKTEFLKAVELDPGFTEAYNNLGLISQKMKEYDEAAKYFEKALELDDANSAAHINYGILGWETQNFPVAARELEAAMRLDRKYASNIKFLLAAGVSHYKTGGLEKAQEYLNTALSMQPDAPMAHFHLGLIHEELGEKEKAAEEYREEVKMFPSNKLAVQKLRELESQVGGKIE